MQTALARLRGWYDENPRQTEIASGNEMAHPQRTFSLLMRTTRPVSLPQRERLVQSENGEDCRVHTPLLLWSQASGQISEAGYVHGAKLLHQDLGCGSFNLDFWSERCRSSTRRRGGDEDH